MRQLRLVTSAGCPYLLRVWFRLDLKLFRIVVNFLEGINYVNNFIILRIQMNSLP